MMHNSPINTKANIPKHIAIIMDGNGRWARSKGLLRIAGHKSGTNAVRQAIEGCAEAGVKFLTLYAFSTENWNRPKIEVDTLMKLLVNVLKNELHSLLDNNIKLQTIGNINNLPKAAQKELNDVIEKSKNNSRMTVVLALSYGSREELIKTIQDISIKVKNNVLSPHFINEEVVNEHLYTKNLPSVDLLIRTSGEQRISNFMLWQIAYAELYFTKVLWPDFKKEHLFEAIRDYQQRERRFGKTSEQLN